MNPRTNYEDGDTVTTRAFFTLFRKCGDVFQFAIDGGVDDDEEVRAGLITDDIKYDGKTTIGVTAINEEERFNRVVETARDMGLIVETEKRDEYHEELGDYTGYVMTAYAPSDLSAEWNVPHLLVYGSLSPEVEDACYAAFGTSDGVQFENVRNHFLVYGEDVTENARDELVQAVQRSNEFFDDMKRDTVSSINTADFV